MTSTHDRPILQNLTHTTPRRFSIAPPAGRKPGLIGPGKRFILVFHLWCRRFPRAFGKPYGATWRARVAFGCSAP
ncbi:hypothetical protein CN106_19210 [Sinorhizobium meliloti]|nr:hypothetical protein CN127_20605 [Sinorhizobium meliloti]RVN65764.1 hypothetical protein CN106_19210 [Sinorhizobium meliloti]